MTKHFSVLTLALGLALAAPLPGWAQADEAFSKGVSAYEDGDYEAAAVIWSPLAEDGSPEAQRNLAQLYRLGLGVQKDDERAYELYTAAAEQNSVEAQVNVAFQLLTGEGVEKDSKQAALWFAKAADQGDALAQFNLGLMYEKGVGVPQDRELARELYRLSANQGQERALARLDAIEGDLPPDGGEQARKERDETREKEKTRTEAAERERERQEADVKRIKDNAKAKAEEEERSRMQKAEAEAKTGPILMIEKIAKDPEEEETEDAAAVAAVKNVETAFKGKAPTTTPVARAKPPLARKPAARPGATVADARPAAAPTAMQSDKVRQFKNAEAAYMRGDFRNSLRLLAPLVDDGVPLAQFLLGRMFNRGEGVTLDHFKAYSLWRSAASSGSERAATALANFSNRFSPEDLARAEQYHQARLAGTISLRD